MNNHRKIIFILILCALYVIYSVHKALAETPPEIDSMPGVCTAIMPFSSLLLDAGDTQTLTLANAFTTKLQREGQDSSVVKSIYVASLRSGVKFELLLLKAIMESDLGRFTIAANSTARGVFQYIEPTWLVLMKRYGAQAGYARLANAISMTKGTGIPYIREKNMHLKAEILALRHDPDVAAMIKAQQIREETDMIRELKHGEEVTPTDHYIAHMLGLPLARELYDLKDKNSVIAVAGLNRTDMREATRLNRAFFYEGKRALTAPEVYRNFERRVAREFQKMKTVALAQQQPCLHKPETQQVISRLDIRALDKAALPPEIRSSFAVSTR